MTGIFAVIFMALADRFRLNDLRVKNGSLSGMPTIRLAGRLAAPKRTTTMIPLPLAWALHPRNRLEGIRISTAIGYLGPARHRLNLTIRPGVSVHRVTIESGRATGLDVQCDGVMQNIRGRRITLSAGAINSPSILMRSGIGRASELEALGIKCVVNLTGVGQNLVDHPMQMIAAKPVSGLQHDRHITIPLIVRYTAKASHEFNDMQLFACFFFDESLIAGFQWPVPPPVLLFGTSLQRPRSRGYLRLTTADPNAPVEIHLNFVDHPEDMRRMMQGIRATWNLMRDGHLTPYIKEVIGVTQETIDSESELAAFIRGNCISNFHPVGTAKMGPDSDKDAVVDQYCRVRGIEGLRVVDASVMPNIVRANTNLTCIMIGERVADWMRAEEA